MGPVGRSPREDDRWHVQGTVRHGSAFFSAGSGRRNDLGKVPGHVFPWRRLPARCQEWRNVHRIRHRPPGAAHFERHTRNRAARGGSGTRRRTSARRPCRGRTAGNASVSLPRCSEPRRHSISRPALNNPIGGTLSCPTSPSGGPARSQPRLTSRLCLHGCLLRRCRDIRNCGRSRELLRQCELERLVFLAPTLVTLTCRRPSRSDRRASPTACRERRKQGRPAGWRCL